MKSSENCENSFRLKDKTMKTNGEIRSGRSSAKKLDESLSGTIQRKSFRIGQIKNVSMINFMCHKNFSIDFEPIPLQIVTGANGSGKSTIANAICLCLGAQARTTGRTNNAQSFIRKGENVAELTIVLANEGAEAFKPEIYGNEIRIQRRIALKQSNYKIFGENKKVISTRKETINEILEALSIAPENPLCVLHQEISKNFLLNNDPRKKYQFYMKVSQLDQIKQAYEDALCTISSIRQRIQIMREKSDQLFRGIEPYEREIKKIDIRREKENEKRQLESELVHARHIEIQQEILSAEKELDQTQRTKDQFEMRMITILDELRSSEKRSKDLETSKKDLVKDLDENNGLRVLSLNLCQEKKDKENSIYRLAKICEKLYENLREIDEEKIFFEKRSEEFGRTRTETENRSVRRSEIEKNLEKKRDEQKIFKENLENLKNEIESKNISIERTKSTIEQAEKEIFSLENFSKNEENLFGDSTAEFFRSIESEKSFHRKPIGPISRHVRCTDSRWSYAVEKHLASVLNGFICHDQHDEKILLNLFKKFSEISRPTIFVTKHTEKVHDVSGTAEKIRAAKLVSIHEIIRVENPTVECVLIDFRHIEATILVESLAQANKICRSAVLRWPKVHRKVKQVVEAWTLDGSNIKMDRAFRIYTTDREPPRFFLSNVESTNFHSEIKEKIQKEKSQKEILQNFFNKTIEQRKILQQKFDEIRTTIDQNEKIIRQFDQDLDRIQSTMKTPEEFNFEILREKLDELENKKKIIEQQFDEVKQKKEVEHQQLSQILLQCENVTKKIDVKRSELDSLSEQIESEKNFFQQIQQQIPMITKKTDQLNEDLQKCQEKIQTLTKKQTKKLKNIPMNSIRSTKEIEQQLDAINKFLKENEDNLEKRRKMIEEYKIKRDEAQNEKRKTDRSERQLNNLENFVRKRQERFAIIADQHQYFLRHKFTKLMEKENFHDAQIKIDHKNEILQIVARKNQRSTGSLSGGERSISTICFLLALWESIYQPFRLLDEIDIYMDHQKRNSCLELLYENTKFYSSSQHVIFTPQSVDGHLWKELGVPMFSMPTPKRSFA